MSAVRLSGPILAGDDDVRSEAWILGGRITYERPFEVSETLSGWVVPGMVDMHCHLSIGPGGPVDEDQAEKFAAAERDAGVLAVRDVGSAGDLSALVGQPGLPRIIGSGRFIARPRRYLPGYAVEVQPDELAEQAAIEAKRGGGWVKLIADWIDRDLSGGGDLSPLWEPKHVADAVAAAHKHGARVTAHTFSTEAIDALIDGGVDCIEHGTGITEAQAERIARRGVPVVPTMQQVRNFIKFAEQGEAKFPKYAERMRSMYQQRYVHARMLHEAGVTLLMGSDAGTTIAHANPVAEAREMARAIPAVDVVAGATWRARKFLGLGVLEEGDPADLVVLKVDPRKEISTLGEPQAVVLNGDRVR